MSSFLRNTLGNLTFQKFCLAFVFVLLFNYYTLFKINVNTQVREFTNCLIKSVTGLEKAAIKC